MNENNKEELVNKICDNIQIFSAIEEVKNTFGEIENKDLKSFLINLFEYIEALKEQNEEAKKELEYRNKLLKVLKEIDFETDALIKANQNEINRAEDLINNIETVIKMNEFKISKFNEIINKIPNFFELLQGLNFITGNRIGLESYEEKLFEIREELNKK